MLKGGGKRIPLYSKAGWITAWLFIIVIIVIAMRGCIGAVYFSRTTDPANIQRYFALGLKNGREGLRVELPEAATENPLLCNAYNKGFREGWDEATTNSKK